MKNQLLQLLILTALLAPSAFAASPTIVCSGDQALECTSSNGAVGVVQATVQDTDGDGLMVIWTVNGLSTLTNVLASGSTSNAVSLYLTNHFGFGTNDVTVGVTDDGTNIVLCSSTVVVQDTTPPVIDRILATPNVLWPPNHKLVPIRLVVRAHDLCGPVTWRVYQVTSNEAEDALGSGHTAPDWVINAEHRALVRAERSGRGSGRVYTITVEATDDAGNAAYGDVHVLVPHDKGHHKWRGDADDDDDDDDDQGQPGKGKGKGKAKGKNK